MNPTIYGYIKEQEADFETQKIQIADNWDWNFREHVQMLFHLVNDKFYTGSNDYLRAFKQVIEPMIELSSWTEDLEVKDVTFLSSRKTNAISLSLLRSTTMRYTHVNMILIIYLTVSQKTTSHTEVCSFKKV
jgi:hypothetical protein